MYTLFSLQTYLSFGLSKVATKELSKLRISAQDLLISRGRYFRPRVPREKLLRTSCNKIEDEEHFIRYCIFFFSLICTEAYRCHEITTYISSSQETLFSERRLFLHN